MSHQIVYGRVEPENINEVPVYVPLCTDDAGKLILSGDTPLTISIDDPLNLEATQQEVKAELINIKDRLTTIDTNSAPVERQTNSSYFTGNLTAGNTTASIDLGIGKNRLSVIQFGGKSDTSNFSFVIEYSNDNITFATDGYEPQLTLVGTEYRFNLTRTSVCMRFVRLLCINAGNNVAIAYSTIK
jgi:hypothetical protein